MKKLIVNADDFGLTKAVSDSIIKVFKIGNLSSTTIMINMPATDYAINLAKKYYSLGIGLHFNITEGRSVVGKSSLTNENGYFLGKMNLIKKILSNNLNLDDINNELYVQYQYLKKAEVSVSHIDSHQHIHMNPKLFKLVADFAKDMKLKIRIAFPQSIRRSVGKINYKKRIKQIILNYASKRNKEYADSLCLKYNHSFNSIFDFHPFQMPNIEDYQKLTQISKSNKHELMIHPYTLSNDLFSI